MGGIGADPENLTHMKRIADKLFGEDYYWSILAAGRPPASLRHHGRGDGRQCPRRTRGFALYRQGPARQDNAEQVSRIRSILENLSLEIASPTEARQMLALKGGDRVTF